MALPRRFVIRSNIDYEDETPQVPDAASEHSNTTQQYGPKDIFEIDSMQSSTNGTRDEQMRTPRLRSADLPVPTLPITSQATIRPAEPHTNVERRATSKSRPTPRSNAPLHLMQVMFRSSRSYRSPRVRVYRQYCRTRSSRTRRPIRMPLMYLSGG